MRKFYVYKYFDSDNNLLYVGQTIDFIKRYRDHSNDSSWFKDHVRYEVAEVKNKTLMDMYEVYMINKLSPIHNVADARNDEIPFDLPELIFEVKDMTNCKYVKPVTKVKSAMKVETSDVPFTEGINNIITHFEANNPIYEKISDFKYVITLNNIVSMSEITTTQKMFSYKGDRRGVTILQQILASEGQVKYWIDFTKVHDIIMSLPQDVVTGYNLLEKTINKGA